MKFTRIILVNMTKYLAGFLLVFFCSIMVYVAAKSSIETYIIEQARTKTEEGIRAIEETVEKMDIIAQMMYQSNDFVLLTYQEEDFYKEDILKIKDNNKLLVNAGIMADYVPYMFVVFKNNNLYVSSSQCSFSFDDYYGSFLSIHFEEERVTDADTLKEVLFQNELRGRKFLKVKAIDYFDDGKEQHLDDVLIYLTNGQASVAKPVHMFCFVFSKEYLIENILLPEFREESFVYIQDIKTGEQLITYGNVPDSVLSDINDIENNSDGHCIISRENELGWNIVVGLPKTFVVEQMEPVRHLLMMYLEVGFLAVVAMAVFFSMTRFHGFKKIIFTLPDDIKKMDNSNLNDYNILQDAVLMVDKKRKVLEQQNKAIILENLMTYGIHTDQERRVFEEYFSKIPEFYCVVLVRYSQIDMHMLESATLDIVQQLKEAQVKVIGNVHSGLADELFLIDLSEIQETNVNGVTAIFEALTGKITEKYDVMLHVGISTIGTGLENVNKCYEQVKQIVQAEYVFEAKSVVNSYSIKNNALKDNPMTIEFLNRLCNMLVSGQLKEVEKELEQIKSQYDRMPYLYEMHKDRIFYTLQNVFYTAMLNLNCRMENVLPVYTYNLTCAEMFNIYAHSAEHICEYLKQSQRTKTIKLKEDILQYIDEHFHEPGLSGYVVAQKMGISEKYLYKFWKEHLQGTFTSYLLQLRISKAKEYLEHTNYSNEQIAELTGFVAENTFYRNFNKLVGCTPKNYRENLTKDVSEN